MPISDATSMEPRPTISAVGAPYTSRERTSNPIRSVPSGCAQLGGALDWNFSIADWS
jgi:hypothetical protein